MSIPEQPASPCDFLNEAAADEGAEPSAFEAHLATCGACTQALARVATLSKKLGTWTASAEPPTRERIGPVLAEQRRLDALLLGFALTQFIGVQIAGGGFASPLGNRALGGVAVLVVGVGVIGWARRRSLLRNFATDTLVGHLRVTTRAAERRVKALVIACAGWVVLCIAAIPFAGTNPYALVPWLTAPAPRLAMFAIGPAVFAVYGCFVTLPRLAAVRSELERT